MTLFRTRPGLPLTAIPDAMEPFISKDGQYLFFDNRNDPYVNTDLFYAARLDEAPFIFLENVPALIARNSMPLRVSTH
jgi:hypothetical protein